MSVLDFVVTPDSRQADLFITESKAVGFANHTWHLIRGAVGFRVRQRVATQADRSSVVGWIVEYIDARAERIGFAAS